MIEASLLRPCNCVDHVGSHPQDHASALQRRRTSHTHFAEARGGVEALGEEVGRLQEEVRLGAREGRKDKFKFGLFERREEVQRRHVCMQSL